MIIPDNRQEIEIDYAISINKSDIFFYKTRLVMQIKVNQKAIENSLHYNHEFAN